MLPQYAAAIIAARCEESLSARGFLGYGLEEATLDHSSFTVIRDRLSLEQPEAIHRVLLVALRGHGLLRGRKLGIDCQRPPALPFGLPAAGYLAPLGCSVIEANASLRALEHRNTEESYWDYVRRLAAEAGIELSRRPEALRRHQLPRVRQLLQHHPIHQQNDPPKRPRRPPPLIPRNVYALQLRRVH